MGTSADPLSGDHHGAGRHRLAGWFGPFSPFATLSASSPGARVLLAQAEQDAERLLHLLRICMWAVAWIVGLFVFGVADVAPMPFLLLSLGLCVILLAGIWHHLGHAQPSLGLRCALILLDGFAIARGVTLLVNPGGLFSVLAPDLYPAMLAHISRGDVGTITPPMLVFLAATGAFRLEPRLAAFSTLVALAVYACLHVVLPAPPGQALAIGCIILFTGVLGANAARVLRYLALKASEEQVLERYVPSALTWELARSGDPERAARVEEITVLTADLRGFTRLSEHLTPPEAVHLLNDYFAVVVAPLAHENAVLDKYIGDGLLAFFEGPRHAERALRAGRAILTAVQTFNATRPSRPALRTGVAIHAGQALVGTIGPPSRREYTVIGDVVNVTARLEEFNKELPSDLIISDDALRLAAPSSATSGLRGPMRVAVRGREAGVSVHYLVPAGG